MQSTSPFYGNLISKEGEIHSSEIKAPIVLIYFSAHWCPPCRNFTPVLAELYEEWNKDEKQVEVIFVSSDSDEKTFKEYFDSMPWLAVPFGDSRIQQVKMLFNVTGIPCLVLVNKEGVILEKNARNIVANYGVTAVDHLKKY
jgi:nucleoredoxin